jgi:hypothetical protein
MPRTHTAQYAGQRTSKVQRPQAIVRFFHVSDNELLIQTSDQPAVLAANEVFSGTTMLGIQVGASEGQYRFAQGIRVVNNPRTGADLRLALLLQKQGTPGGNLLAKIQTSQTDSTPEIAPNQITVGHGNWVRDGGGTPRMLDGAFALITTDGVQYGLGGGQTAPLKVGSFVNDQSGEWLVTEGTVVAGDASFAPLFEWSDGRTFGHSTIPASTIERPSGVTITNGTFTFPVGSIGTAPSFVEVILPASSKPNPGPQVPYHIVLEWDGTGTAWDSSNHIKIGVMQGSGGYADGALAVNSQGAPSTWTVRSADDMAFKLSEVVVTAQGLNPVFARFSRDFTSGQITGATAPGIRAIKPNGITGNTQTVTPQEGKSTQGALSVNLVDLAGEVGRQVGSYPLRVNAIASETSPGPGDWLTFNEAATQVDYLPAIGTIEVRSDIGGGVFATERIRYSEKDAANSRIKVAGRGVDGTTPRAHALNDLAVNGEVIRAGQRMQLLLGYEGLPESQFMSYGVWEVRRAGAGTRSGSWQSPTCSGSSARRCSSPTRRRSRGKPGATRSRSCSSS